MIYVLSVGGHDFIDQELCAHCDIARQQLFAYPTARCDHPDCRR